MKPSSDNIKARYLDQSLCNTHEHPVTDNIFSVQKTCFIPQ